MVFDLFATPTLPNQLAEYYLCAFLDVKGAPNWDQCAKSALLLDAKWWWHQIKREQKPCAGMPKAVATHGIRSRPSNAWMNGSDQMSDPTYRNLSDVPDQSGSGSIGGEGEMSWLAVKICCCWSHGSCRSTLKKVTNARHGSSLSSPKSGCSCLNHVALIGHHTLLTWCSTIQHGWDYEWAPCSLLVWLISCTFPAN